MIKKLALAFLIIHSSLALAKGNVIALTGEATINVIPDIIRIKVEITKVEKSDVAIAKSKVDSLSSEVATALIAMGVKDTDITSSSLKVYTADKYDENDNRIPSGFAASRKIDITLRDLKTYGPVVQKLVDIGVTEIGEAKPDVSDKEKLNREALAKAAQAARSKAEFLASQFDAKLGRVYKIGNQRVDSDFDYLDEIIVTARKQSASGVKTVQYDFKPAPVEVKSSIYVEFELEKP